jgi:hypothetical protein
LVLFPIFPLPEAAQLWVGLWSERGVKIGPDVQSRRGTVMPRRVSLVFCSPSFWSYFAVIMTGPCSYLTQASSYLRAFFFLIHFIVNLVLDFPLVPNTAFFVFISTMIFFSLQKKLWYSLCG